MKITDFYLEDLIYLALANRTQVSGKKPHTPLWELCWRIRAHPDVRDLPATEALAMVEQIFQSGRLQRKVSWLTDFGMKPHEARIEFCSLWDSVKHPYGGNSVESAVQRANVAPLSVPDSPDRLFTVFVSAAYYLAEGAHDGAVFLPCILLGKHLGCSAMTVSRMRQLAVKRDYLSVVTPHAFRLGQKGNATEFRADIFRLAEFVRPELGTKVDPVEHLPCNNLTR